MERLKESFHIALANVTANAIRSFLSILGIVIGIASVITVLAFGAGARQEILKRVTALGANVYNVYARYDEKTGRMGRLELEDAERLGKLSFVLSVSPQLNLYKEIRTRQAVSRGTIKGVDLGYVSARGLRLVEGRDFSPLEMENRGRVCLLYEAAAGELFPDGRAAGKTLYVEGNPWEVIGVYALSANEPPRRLKAQKALEVLVPLATLIRDEKDVNMHSLEVQVRPDHAKEAPASLTAALERDDEKRKGLFQVMDQKEFFARSLEIKKALSLIGALVAGISLIVGGIGMMNVMLTSVAERTREIGIRRAVGARRKDILFQFLVEACVLSGLGGILGLLFGAALARALPIFFSESISVTPRIQPAFLVIAVGSGVILGIVFGLYPAIKASHLSPAEALRSE